MVIAFRKVGITVRLPESPAVLDRWVCRLDKSWLVTIGESERTLFWLKCIWTLDPKRLVHLSSLLAVEPFPWYQGLFAHRHRVHSSAASRWEFVFNKHAGAKAVMRCGHRASFAIIVVLTVAMMWYSNMDTREHASSARLGQVEEGRRVTDLDPFHHVSDL